ncbi:hypothetical protein SASPL_153626 [Salvia splendens]|uniref:Uncharacterized protein n=1 Tax=Salvia splendens TaxID=180675 RepID=A0A8X8YXI9_SALSN|nr:uncharacterized protein LOC121787813 [Salvia splendens]KAG6384807.1 hypothetical protein SASPL_153626 [Salvia splendens]
MLHANTRDNQTETESIELAFGLMASSPTLGDPDYLKRVQASLDSTMPWIGMYIAAASAVCTLAMAADAFIGFRSKKYWLPCKYFSLNAFSLVLLAVAMKLPVDLTSLDLTSNDKLARLSSLYMMSTAMNNFMTSLGSTENNDIVLNMAALGILVITIAANVYIHIVQILSSGSMLYVLLPQQMVSSALMLLFLATLCSVSLMVPGAKRCIGLKYNEMHKSVSNRQVEWGRFRSDELENMVKGYWVMAQTSSPQFVLARSAISSTLGFWCLFTAAGLVEARISHRLLYPRYKVDSSVFVTSKYRWSVGWILNIQCTGVAIGTIAPLLRWFVASWFKISEMERKSFRDEVKVDKYWTWRLVEWRDRSLPFQVQSRASKKLLRDAVRFVLNFCIGVQILVVLAAKLVLFLSARFGRAVLLCLRKNERPVLAGAHVDFSQYVLLLDGEPQLPYKILKNICNEADELIKGGEKRQPKNLIQLLKKSSNFNGLGRFDRCEIPSLHSQEPPNCWSLPVVTLTAISVSLLNFADEKANQLMVCISEGLPIVKLIEETLDSSGELESVRKTADVVWIGAEVYRKWEDADIKSTSVRGTTHKETLQNLSRLAEKIVTDFVAQTRDILMQNPLNWPARVISANSMYRISQTILLGMGDGENQTDDELFESISITISDILAACLTNLVQVITLKCHRHDIKEREESVRRAAILLGESKEIFDILQQRELPCLDMEKAAKIDEWRASLALDIENPLASSSPSSSDSSTTV